MSCLSPLNAFRDRLTRKIHFKKSDAGLFGEDLVLPCGSCVACKLERARQWALRCKHEASLYSNNSFLTLTYNDESLPHDGSLCLRDLQCFMKRFRKFVYPLKLRFFACGEYGAKFSRPHYHLLIFGYNFPDLSVFRVRRGVTLFTSSILSKLWPYGFSTVGALTYDSACYVARYSLKKRKRSQYLGHYQEVNLETGEILADRTPEFVVMSRRPGIAHDWYQRFKSDVFPHDYVIHDGFKHKPPKYYDSLYELESPDDLKRIKFLRSRLASSKFSVAPDVNEYLVNERVSRLVRGFESGLS